MPPFLSSYLKLGKITALCPYYINTEWKKSIGQANSTKAKLNICPHVSVRANHTAGKEGFSETLAVTEFLKCRVNQSQGDLFLHEILETCCILWVVVPCPPYALVEHVKWDAFV